jgi:YVTN family beta-propeller protein
MNVIQYILFLALLPLSLQAWTQTAPGISIPANSRQSTLPYNRILQPAGTQIFFGDYTLENHSLDAALSPDEKWLAVEERSSIVFISTENNQVVFSLYNNQNRNLVGAMNTFSGITWYKGIKGLEVFWSVSEEYGRSFVVSALWNGLVAVFDRIYSYISTPPAATALPNEILVSREGMKEYLYVVLNGCNLLLKQNLITGDTIWTANPGVAPYGIVKAARKLYVTNWAGRHPSGDDKEVAGVPWGLARVDNKNGGGTREGSVTVIDPRNGEIIKEIVTGLHPNEIISDRKGRYLYVTNSNSDNISVIETGSDEVCETISIRLQPDINPFFGDSPDGLCLSKNEKVLYVANGMDNALAVISLGKKASGKGRTSESYVTGFIPTGGYPSSVCISSVHKLYVSNLEAAGATLGLELINVDGLVYNSHRMLASVSVIPVPGKKELEAYTDTVIAVNDLSRAMTSMAEPRPGIEPKPVPERIGEPSVFRHVVYIIKENRTYDQVLGDMEQGNGNPALCIYGENVTPNAHRLAEEFGLLDNYHASGKCSADGHQWTDASIVTDYIEKNTSAWFRGYAHVQTDALVYAPTGFLWDNAVKHGKTVRIYGEASVPLFSTPMTWTDVYNAFLNGEKVDFKNVTTVKPVESLLSQTYPSYGNHEFPDIMRADAFIKELHSYENMEGDHLPELMILALPDDHTAGIAPGYPTPMAMVADNDYALGQIVEALTKSRFWKNTVIFVTEDDSQDGWDHVSAYRTVGFVLSPYSRLKSTDHTYYTQPSMVRTIEQILGLPPMNIQDAIAPTMSSCFTAEPDLTTTYKALPNNIPLNEMNRQLSSLSGKALYYARKSMLPEFKGVDTGDDDLLNRILWFAAKGNEAYPAKYAGKHDDPDDDEPWLPERSDLK